MAIQDYNADQELDDPTDPNETVKKTLLNKLALALTRAEEACQHGSGEMDMATLYDKRGAFLDQLDDPVIAESLIKMRKSGRCPFRKFHIQG